MINYFGKIGKLSIYEYPMSQDLKRDIESGKLINLELGCGPADKRMQGFYGLDIDPELKPDIVCDLEEGIIPLPSDICKYIWMDYILEHLSNVGDIMQEIWRVGINGAMVYIGVPYYSWEGQHKDYSHKTTFAEDSYKYWDVREASVPHYGHTSKFDLINIERRFATWATNEQKMQYKLYNNILEKLGFYLKVVK